MPTNRPLPAPIRLRDSLAIAWQVLGLLPAVVALVAYGVRAPDVELTAIAYGLLAFVVSVLYAAATLLPSFRAETRRTVWVLLLGQVFTWFVWLGVSGGRGINM